MTIIKPWVTAAAITAAFLCLGAALDGPDDTETAQAIAADKQDAEAQASRDWVLAKVCPKGGQWVADKELRCTP